MSESDTETERPEDGIAAADIDAVIDRWRESGGSELANFQTFAGELSFVRDYILRRNAPVQESPPAPAE